ncbi:MAG: hypothetical protein HWN68_18510 [Desulfobacterales bacterium]|nr:hypothetical protein [Desulfobacterales bacterium]
MEIAELENESLFINILLYAASDTPSEFIRPVFVEAGYNLRSIEPNIPIDIVKIDRIRDNFPVRQASKPELILYNEHEAALLLLECKTSSFSGTSSTAAQTRAYLILDTADYRSLVGIDKRSRVTNIVYYLIIDRHEDFPTVLLDISEKISELVGNVNPITSSVLTLRDNSLFISKCDPVLNDVNVFPNLKEELLIKNFDRFTRPIFLIPMLKTSTEFEEAVKEPEIIERIKRTIISEFGKHLDDGSVEFELDGLITVAFPLFRTWISPSDNYKNTVRGYFRRFFRAFASRLSSFGINLEFAGPVIRMTFDTADKGRLEKDLVRIFRLTPDDVPEEGLFN